jgi:hypothetical protein
MEKQLEVTKSLDFSELKDLVNVEGPCITIYMPLEPSPNTSRLDFMRLKSIIRRAEDELTEREIAKPLRQEMIESLREVGSEANAWGGEGGSLLILRSPDVFRAFQVKQRHEERLVVSDHFQLFPAVAALHRGSQRFYVLALSQNHVRLLRATYDGLGEEVDMGPNVPRSLGEWLNTRPPNTAPEHGAVRTSETGETGGSFTSTHDRDNKDEHIANFFRAINRAVFDRLRDERHPIVLCGVESQRTIYRQVNTHPGVMEEGVQGSPESFTGVEMHHRALVIAQEHFSQPARKALALWEKVAGGERASTSFPDIVKAAFEARIAHLFVAENAQAMGVFDRSTMQMRVQGRHEDLVNAAAMQTIAYGGDVFVCKPEDVPGGSQMAAILRF